MRRTVPVVLVTTAVAALALAGCTSSSAPTSKAQSCAGLTSGSASDGVKVTGDVGSQPTVKLDTPVSASKTERTIVTSGSGATADKGVNVDVAIAVYNGRTGTSLGTQGWGSSQAVPFQVGSSSYPSAFTQAVECLPTGSRSVLVAPASKALPSSSLSQLKLKKTDSIVIVSDLIDVVPSKATGTPVPAPSGFPTVKTDASGKPTVTMPSTPPPTETKVADLRKGDGPVVKKGDTVTVQYQGSIYGSGKVFDQSWGRGPASFPTTGVIAGFSEALVGQHVGSRVIAVIPPKDGYGSSGNAQAGISGTDTLVFVVDILGTSSSSSSSSGQ